MRQAKLTASQNLRIVVLVLGLFFFFDFIPQCSNIKSVGDLIPSLGIEFDSLEFKTIVVDQVCEGSVRV